MTSEEAFDARVLLMLAGQNPMSCAQLAKHLDSDPFTTRESLKRLKKAREVIEIERQSGPLLYEKAHGGYSPGGSAA